MPPLLEDEEDLGGNGEEKGAGGGDGGGGVGDDFVEVDVAGPVVARIFLAEAPIHLVVLPNHEKRA